MESHEHSSAEKFVDLPEHTKEFLTKLRPEEIKELEEILVLFRSMETVSRFMKWMLITIVACFVTVVSLGESFLKMTKWWKD
jgi:hypothetical protein